MKYCVLSVVVESVTFSDIVMLYEQVRTCRLSGPEKLSSAPRSTSSIGLRKTGLQILPVE